MKLIDAHAHLTFKSFKKDVDVVIERARKAGLIAIINCSVDARDFEKAVALARRYPGFIFITAGAPPQMLTEQKLRDFLEVLEKRRGEYVGVGEIGLDYYWVRDDEAREFTKRALRELVSFAVSNDLPIVIHNRDALDDVVEILSREGAERVVFHAFMGSKSDAKRILERGWYLSIPTMVNRLEGLRRVVRSIPLEKMFLETDSPFLAPFPRTRNEPANVRISAEVIAREKEMSPERVAEATSKNVIEFFNLPLSV